MDSLNAPDAHLIHHSKKYSQRRLRLACDFCHGAKIRCSGGQPCRKCEKSNLDCHYSHTARLGKPKGSRNKKTLEKLGLLPPGTVTSMGTTGAGADFEAALEEVTRDEQQESRRPDSQGHCEVGRTSSSPPAATEPSMAMGWLSSSPPCPPLGYGWEFPLQTDEDVFRGHLGIDMPCVSSLPDKSSINMITPPMDQDIWDILGGAPVSQGEISLGTNDMTFENNAEWEPYYPAKGTSCKTTYLTLTPDEKLPSPPQPPPQQHARGFSNATSSPSLTSEGEPACACLEILTDQLSHLSKLERRRASIRVDATLSRTREALLGSEDVLACPSCRVEPKILLLLARLLHVVIGWAEVGLQHRGLPPPIYFGDWRVDEEDGHLVKTLLAGQILTGGNMLVSVLRARLGEVIRAAGRQNTGSQWVYVDELQRTLQRLTGSLRELSQQARHV